MRAGSRIPNSDARSTQSSVNGEDNCRCGWHPNLIAEVLGMKVNGVGQTVFYDDQADYPYRGLLKGDDMPLVSST